MQPHCPICSYLFPLTPIRSTKLNVFSLQDKAIKRFQVRNLVDASTKRDLEDQAAIENYEMPKLYIKTQYCVSCAIHSRIVHVRARDERRNRNPPPRRVPAAVRKPPTTTAAAAQPVGSTPAAQ